MFNFAGFFRIGKPKCAQCGVELKKEFYEWQGKKFCCKACKRAYRLRSRKKGSRCH